MEDKERHAMEGEDELGAIILDQDFDDMRQNTGRLTLGVMDNLWKPTEGGDETNGMGGTRKMPKRTI